ncbi:MAG: LytTR family DNA-binding domain-containing protein [Pseudomonadota bacterium]
MRNPLLGTSARNLRLMALVAAFVAKDQLTNPLAETATTTESFLYWGVRLVAVVVFLWSADALVERFTPKRYQTPLWLKPVVFVSVVALIPFALVELLMETWVPVRAPFDDEEWMSVSPILAYLGEFGTLVSVVIPVHLGLWLIIDRPNLGVPNPEVDEQSPEFLSKTAGVTLEDVVALHAEEHYVRVYSGSTSELIHHRFGDAAGEMPDTLGLQVHRSWWVADKAVTSAKRGDRRWKLVLRDAVEVPVSDSYVQVVRKRGLLRNQRPQ